MFKGLKNEENMMILVYPNSQRDVADTFLSASSYDFKKPEQLIDTHCTQVEVVWQTKEETRLCELKTPQVVKDFELIVRNPDTEDYFVSTLEKFQDLTEGINVSQILNLYCVFDESISNCPKEDLTVEERTAQNYINNSETFAA